jgi:hypothetical protein
MTNAGRSRTNGQETDSDASEPAEEDTPTIRDFLQTRLAALLPVVRALGNHTLQQSLLESTAVRNALRKVLLPGLVANGMEDEERSQHQEYDAIVSNRDLRPVPVASFSKLAVYHAANAMLRAEEHEAINRLHEVQQKIVAEYRRLKPPTFGLKKDTEHKLLAEGDSEADSDSGRSLQEWRDARAVAPLALRHELEEAVAALKVASANTKGHLLGPNRITWLASHRALIRKLAAAQTSNPAKTVLVYDYQVMPIPDPGLAAASVTSRSSGKLAILSPGSEGSPQADGKLQEATSLAVFISQLDALLARAAATKLRKQIEDDLAREHDPGASCSIGAFHESTPTEEADSPAQATDTVASGENLGGFDEILAEWTDRDLGSQKPSLLPDATLVPSLQNDEDNALTGGFRSPEFRQTIIASPTWPASPPIALNDTVLSDEDLFNADIIETREAMQDVRPPSPPRSDRKQMRRSHSRKSKSQENNDATGTGAISTFKGISAAESTTEPVAMPTGIPIKGRRGRRPKIPKSVAIEKASSSAAFSEGSNTTKALVTEAIDEKNAGSASTGWSANTHERPVMQARAWSMLSQAPSAAPDFSNPVTAPASPLSPCIFSPPAIRAMQRPGARPQASLAQIGVHQLVFVSPEIASTTPRTMYSGSMASQSAESEHVHTPVAQVPPRYQSDVVPRRSSSPPPVVRIAVPVKMQTGRSDCNLERTQETEALQTPTLHESGYSSLRAVTSAAVDTEILDSETTATTARWPWFSNSPALAPEPSSTPEKEASPSWAEFQKAIAAVTIEDVVIERSERNISDQQHDTTALQQLSMSVNLLDFYGVRGSLLTGEPQEAKHRALSGKTRQTAYKPMLTKSKVNASNALSLLEISPPSVNTAAADTSKSVRDAITSPTGLSDVQSTESSSKDNNKDPSFPFVHLHTIDATTGKMTTVLQPSNGGRNKSKDNVPIIVINIGQQPVQVQNQPLPPSLHASDAHQSASSMSSMGSHQSQASTYHGSDHHQHFNTQESQMTQTSGHQQADSAYAGTDYGMTEVQRLLARRVHLAASTACDYMQLETVNMSLSDAGGYHTDEGNCTDTGDAGYRMDEIDNDIADNDACVVSAASEVLPPFEQSSAKKKRHGRKRKTPAPLEPTLDTDNTNQSTTVISKAQEVSVAVSEVDQGSALGLDTPLVPEEAAVAVPMKRKRGRPKKHKLNDEDSPLLAGNNMNTSVDSDTVPKKVGGGQEKRKSVRIFTELPHQSGRKNRPHHSHVNPSRGNRSFDLEAEKEDEDAATVLSTPPWPEDALLRQRGGFSPDFVSPLPAKVPPPPFYCPHVLSACSDEWKQRGITLPVQDMETALPHLPLVLVGETLLRTAFYAAMESYATGIIGGRATEVVNRWSNETGGANASMEPYRPRPDFDLATVSTDVSNISLSPSLKKVVAQEDEKTQALLQATFLDNYVGRKRRTLQAKIQATRGFFGSQLCSQLLRLGSLAGNGQAGTPELVLLHEIKPATAAPTSSSITNESQHMVRTQGTCSPVTAMQRAKSFIFSSTNEMKKSLLPRARTLLEQLRDAAPRSTPDGVDEAQAPCLSNNRRTLQSLHNLTSSSTTLCPGCSSRLQVSGSQLLMPSSPAHGCECPTMKNNALVSRQQLSLIYQVQGPLPQSFYRYAYPIASRSGHLLNDVRALTAVSSGGASTVEEEKLTRRRHRSQDATSEDGAFAPNLKKVRSGVVSSPASATLADKQRWSGGVYMAGN